jgi:hypothetical protein
MNTEQKETRRATLGAWRQWRGRITLAALAVLGLTPWAQAAIQPLPDLPAFCPPLSAFATPTLFDVWFGTTPLRFPYG